MPQAGAQSLTRRAIKLKMMARLETAVLEVAFWMAAILGSLALALTVSGLFSVLSYLIEQRRTEIGVRNGARRDASRHVL
jgi:hypothetical protein